MMKEQIFELYNRIDSLQTKIDSLTSRRLLSRWRIYSYFIDLRINTLKSDQSKCLNLIKLSCQ